MERSQVVAQVLGRHTTQARPASALVSRWGRLGSLEFLRRRAGVRVELEYLHSSDLAADQAAVPD